MNTIIPPLQPTFSSWAAADLSYLDTGRRSPPELPLSVFGSFWANYLEDTARATSAPVDYAAATLLAVTSALIANVRWAQAGASWTEPPILRLANIGSPGSGKSPAQEAPLRLLHHVEEVLAEGFDDELRLYEIEKEVAEAQIRAWKKSVQGAIEAGDAGSIEASGIEIPTKPERPRVRISDTTTEKAGLLAAGLPRGLLLVRDELPGWIGGFDKYGGGGSDRAFWLEAYGGGPYTIDRIKRDDPIRVAHLSIAVLGGIQPDKLPKIIGGADDGFASRFLYTWPEAHPRFSLARDLRDERLAKDALARLATLEMQSEDGGGLGPVRLPLSPEAEDLLEAFGQETVVQAHDAIGPMAAVFSKARGHALRVATVIEFLWWCGGKTGEVEPTHICQPAMRAAVQLVRQYFIPMAERVFRDASIPYADRLAMTLARYIKQAGLHEFNARDLRRKIGGELRASSEMSIACKLLVEANLIRDRPERQGTRPGRPALRFEVNPVLSQSADTVGSDHGTRAISANSAEIHESHNFGANGTIGTNTEITSSVSNGLDCRTPK